MLFELGYFAQSLTSGLNDGAATGVNTLRLANPFIYMLLSISVFVVLTFTSVSYCYADLAVPIIPPKNYNQTFSINNFEIVNQSEYAL